MTAGHLLDIMRTALRLPNLGMDARMGSVRGWDSLRHVRLFLELEKALGVKIPIDMIGALTSVEAIVAYFQTNGAIAA
jgi:acyl carrier protein